MTLSDTSPMLCQLSYQAKSVRVVFRTTVGIEHVVRLTFQLDRCGCTLRVTSQTLYSPEYIPKKIMIIEHIGIEGILDLVLKYHTLEQTWPRNSVGRALN